MSRLDIIDYVGLMFIFFWLADWGPMSVAPFWLVVLPLLVKHIGIAAIIAVGFVMGRKRRGNGGD